MENRYTFVGTVSGAWRVLSMNAVREAPLTSVQYVDVSPASSAVFQQAPIWVLYGVISNVRYGTRAEVITLKEKQEPLGRANAHCAALIPIKKSAAWWELAQDERRAIFEELSHHTAIGVEYLPAIARRLYHSRDLAEPFDFLTWFEYAPEHSAAFEELVGRLRSTKEWAYIER